MRAYIRRMNRLISIGLPVFIIVALIASCNSNEKDNLPLTEGQKSLAVSFLRVNCISCHSVEPGVTSVVAPSMNEIRNSYLQKYPVRREFVDAFTAFVLNPSMDNALMKEAIQKSGLMPKMGYDPEKVELLAEFLFTADIASPGWDAGFTREEGSDKRPQTRDEILEAGKEIALATKAVLGKNLLQAINEKGPSGAVSFCNTRAIQITDSMATHLNAAVSRVSDKPRNAGNAATKEEVAIIEGMKTALANGATPKPALVELDAKWIGYYPIETNDLCLKCHGAPDESTLAVIEKLYPQDQATGYLANQIRGVWKIEMEKK